MREPEAGTLPVPQSADAPAPAEADRLSGSSLENVPSHEGSTRKLAVFRERLSAWMTSLEGPRKLVINGVVIVAAALGVGVVVKAAMKRVYVINTISVPKELEEHGYTSVAVGQRIIDAVAQINREAAITRQIGTYALLPVELVSARSDSTGDETAQGPSAFHSGRLPDTAVSFDDESMKYDISVGGVSLTTMIFYLRELFGRTDTKISGEVTIEKPAAHAASNATVPAPTRFALRLRITGRGIVQQEGAPGEDLESLIQRSAVKVVERFDPLSAAYYSYSKHDYDGALRIAHAVLLDRTTSERPWRLICAD
jgi:hypothetical protein